MPHGMTFGNQITLGQLIEALEPRPEADELRFSVGYLRPSHLASYRGYYEDLAIRYDAMPMKVGEFLALCKEAIGREFTGWKGGEYRMTEDTPVWVANSGDCPACVVTGVIDGPDDITVLTTELVEW